MAQVWVFIHHIVREVSVASDLLDFSLHFISFLIISLITLLFLVPDTFTFLSVFGTLAENNSSTSWAWILIANEMDLGTELERKCCSTSQDPVIQYSVHWQLSIYRAVADMIEELPVGQRVVVTTAAPSQVDNKKLLHDFLTQKCKPMKSDKETRCKNTSNNLKNCQKTRSYPNNAPKQIWDQSKLDNSSMLLRHREEMKIRDQEGTRIKGVDPKQCTIWPSFGHKSLQSPRKIRYWSSSSIFVSTSNRILDRNCERNWQICHRSHAHPRGKESFGETCYKSETNIKTVINKWL